MKKVKLYYLLVWSGGRWKSLDDFTQHFEEDAKNLIKQWKRSGFKAKMSMAGTVAMSNTQKQ